MKPRLFFITGTDTGVGKTVLTCLLARFLRQQGAAVAALKPLCSGGREDARALRAAFGGALSLDEINPWHFRAPLAPRLAARRERKRVELTDVLRHLRSAGAGFDWVLVEGAGGLLSPLGEDFNARDLIVALRATPVVVCPNRLGAVNQALLVLTALPRTLRQRASVVLISGPKSDASCRTNPQLLTEEIGPGRVHVLPWLRPETLAGRAPRPRRLTDSLRAILGMSAKAGTPLFP